MPDASVKITRENLKTYQKQFRYFITDNKPSFTNLAENLNYAYGYHPSHHKIDDCFQKGNHYHIICDKDLDVFNVCSPIPCLINCFHFLLKPTIGTTIVGDKLVQLQNVIYSLPSEDPKMFAFYSHQHNLPVMKTSTKSVAPKRSIDEGDLPMATVKRLKFILDGPYAADFYNIMDMFSSGEGCFDKSSKLVSIKLKLCKIGEK